MPNVNEYDSEFRFHLQVDGLDDVQSASQVAGQLNDKLVSLESTSAKSIDLQFMRDFTTQTQNMIRVLESSFAGTQKSLNSKTLTDYDRGGLSGSLNQTIRGFRAVENEIKSMGSVMQAFSEATKSMSTDMIKGFEKQYGQAMRTMVRDSVANLGSHISDFSGAGGNDRLSELIFKSSNYKKLQNEVMGSVGAAQQQNYTQLMQHMTRAMVHTYSDPMYRGQYMRNFGSSGSRPQPVTYAELLPGAFRQFATKAMPQISDLKNVSASSISNDQKKSLIDLVRSNQVFHQAAVKSGLIRTRNGVTSWNNNANTHNLNAAAGLLMQEMERSARGMSMYGLDDLNSPEAAEKLATKSSKRYTQSLRAMRYLSDHFTDMNPYAATQNVLQTMRNNGSYTSRIGRIAFDVTPNQYEVARYSRNDIDNRSHFVVDPRSITDQAERERVSKHHQAITDSRLVQQVLKHSGRLGTANNNDFLDNIVVYEMPKELYSPHTSKERREELSRQAAQDYLHGFEVPDGKGGTRRFVGASLKATSGHALFIPADIRDAIAKENPTFFTGGVESSQFRDIKDVVKTIENNGKISSTAVPMSSFFGDLNYGKGRKTPKVALVDMNSQYDNPDSIVGVDGMSFVNSRVVGRTNFQARGAQDYKGVLNSANLKFLQDSGVLIPRYGAKGLESWTMDDLVGVGDVDYVLNKKDLKTLGIREMNADGSKKTTAQLEREIEQKLASDNGNFYVMQTAQQAAKKKALNWIASQEAQTFDMSADDAMQFTQRFMDVYNAVGTPEGARKYVFEEGSKDFLDLANNPGLINTKPYQNRIFKFRQAMYERARAGYLLTPEGPEVTQGMISGFLPNILLDIHNKRVKSGLYQEGANKAYDELIGRAQRFALADNEVLDFNNDALDVMVDRAPYTIGSIQRFTNKAHAWQNAVDAEGKKYESKEAYQADLKAFLSDLGLDPNGTYFSPTSQTLKNLQSPDFDGDIARLFGLKDTGNAALDKNVANFMTMLARTINTHTRRRAQGATQDELAQTLKHTNPFDDLFPDGHEFDPNSQADRETLFARVIDSYAQQSVGMGGPNAISRAVFQLPESVANNRALARAQYIYDKNSVKVKNTEGVEATKEDRDLMYLYKPFTEVWNSVRHSKTENDDIDYSAFKDANLFSMNAPMRSMSGSGLASLMIAATLKKNGYDISGGVNLDEAYRQSLEGVRERLTSEGILNDGTFTPETMEFASAVAAMGKGFGNGDFFIPSWADVEKLGDLKKAASAAEGRRFAKIDPKNASYAVSRIIGSLGGVFTDNLFDLSKNLNDVTAADTEQGQMLLALSDIGIDPFSHLSDETIPTIATTATGSPVVQNDIAQKLSLLEQLPAKQLAQKFDNTRFTITSLQSFAENPSKWLAERLGEQQKNNAGTSDSAELGHVFDETMDLFFTEREKLLGTKQDRVLTDDELADLNARTVDWMRHHAENDFQYGSAMVHGADNNRVRQKYKAVEDFIGSGFLHTAFPSQSMKYLGGQQDFKFSNMGTLLTDPKQAIQFTGNPDGIFQYIDGDQKGKLVIIDAKTYGKVTGNGVQATPMSENYGKWRNQTAIYGVSDQIVNGEGSFAGNKGVADAVIVNPLFGPNEAAVQSMNLTPEFIQQNKANVIEAIAAIQSLSQGMSSASRIDAGKAVFKLLFGSESSSRIDDAIQEKMNAAAAQGMDTAAGIGYALTTHEDYKDYLQRTQKMASSFRYMNDDGSNRPVDDPWKRYAMYRNELDTQILGMDKTPAEQARLQAEANKLDDAYYAALLAAPSTQYNKFIEATTQAINGGQASKTANGFASSWKAAQDAYTEANNSYAEQERKIQELTQKKEKADADYAVAQKLVTEQTTNDNTQVAKALEEQAANESAALGVQLTALQTAHTLAGPQKQMAEDTFKQFQDHITSSAVSYLQQQYDAIEHIVDGSKQGKNADQIKQDYINQLNDKKADVALLAKQGILSEAQQTQWDGMFDTLMSDGNVNKYVSRAMQRQAQIQQAEEIQTKVKGQSLLEQITGQHSSSSTMAQLRSESLQNQLAKMLLDNPGSADDPLAGIPGELRKFFNVEPDNNGNPIATINSQAVHNGVFSQMAKQQGLIASQNSWRDTQMMRQATQYADTMQDRYSMSRTQYGPTIIGRAMQYNQQQAMYWRNEQYAAQNHIDQTRERITQLEATRDTYGKDTSEWKNYNDQILAANQSLTTYKAALQTAEDAEKNFSSPLGLMQTSLMNMSNAAENLILRLGRQGLQKAFREAINFSKQFDTSMRQTQAITGKSDDEMAGIRERTLNQAKRMRTSVNNVAQVRQALYRQGLSDTEVDSRAESVLKFSAVTGSNITNSVKQLTTAVQSGLVGSVEEAMDVLVSLGDSAATTAEEIAKGMQKAAASAKVAGVSYAELTSMLTIATSKTQLGGAQAGTFFQTLFSRMTRVTKEGYYTDEGGETSNINDVEAALKNAGIKLRSGKDTFRDTFDVLKDVAGVWSGLNDLQKGSITYAMAGTRNANMFNTLMDGMGEDGGKLLDEYLGLAENSEGTTQKKYEVVIAGINGSLQELQATFDGFVESLGDNNIVTGAIDAVSNLVEGFTNLNEAGTGFASVSSIIVAGFGALAAKVAVMSALAGGPLGVVAGLLSTLVALGAAGGIAAGIGALGNIIGELNSPDNTNELLAAGVSSAAGRVQKKYNNAADAIDTIKQITDEYETFDDLLENAGTEGTEKLAAAVQTLTTSFPGLAEQIGLTNNEMQDFIKYSELAKQASQWNEDERQAQGASLIGDSAPLLHEAVEEAKAKIEEEGQAYATAPSELANYAYKAAGEQFNTSTGEGMNLQLWTLARNPKLSFDGQRAAWVNALDTYLKSDLNRPNDAFSSYHSAQELFDDYQSMMNVTSNEDFNQAALNFALSLAGKNNSMLPTLIAQAQSKHNGAPISAVKSIFNDETYADIWSLITGGNADMQSALIDQYIEQSVANGTELLDADAMGAYIVELLQDSNLYQSRLSPTSKLWNYSVGGENGFGFNDTSPEKIKEAFEERVAYLYDVDKDQADLLMSMFTTNGAFDINKVYNNETAVNNATGLKIYNSASEIAQTIRGQTSHASKGYIDEYAQLLSMWQTMDSWDSFNKDAGRLNNITGLLQQDSDLQRLFERMEAEDWSEALENEMQSHLIAKLFGADSAGAYIASINSQISDLADQQQVYNEAQTGALSPESKSKIASWFNTTYDEVSNYESTYVSLLGGIIGTRTSSVLSDMTQRLVTMADAYMTEQGEGFTAEDIQVDNLPEGMGFIVDYLANHGVKLTGFTGTKGNVSAVTEGTFTTGVPASSLDSTETIFTRAEVGNIVDRMLSNPSASFTEAEIAAVERYAPGATEYARLMRGGKGDSADAVTARNNANKQRVALFGDLLQTGTKHYSDATLATMAGMVLNGTQTLTGASALDEATLQAFPLLEQWRNAVEPGEKARLATMLNQQITQMKTNNPYSIKTMHYDAQTLHDSMQQILAGTLDWNQFQTDEERSAFQQQLEARYGSIADYASLSNPESEYGKYLQGELSREGITGRLQDAEIAGRTSRGFASQMASVLDSQEAFTDGLRSQAREMENWQQLSTDLNSDINKTSKIQAAGQALGWTEKQIRDTVLSGDVTQLQNELNQKQQSLKNDLKEFLQTLTDTELPTDDMSTFLDATIADLEGSGDELKTSIASWLKGIKQTILDQLDNDGKNEFDGTAIGLRNLARYASSVDEQYAMKQTNDKIWQMAEQATTAQEFLDAVASSQDLGFITEKDWIDYLTNSGLGDIIAQMDTQGEISDSQWLAYQQQIAGISNYAGLTGNTTYQSMMGQLNDWAGGNFFGALNDNFDTSGFRDFLADTPDISSWLQSLEGGQEILDAFAKGGNDAKAAINKLATVLSNEGTKANKKFGDATDDTVNSISNLAKNSKSALKETGNIMKNIDDAFDMKTAAQKIRGKSGKEIDGQTAKFLTSTLGLSEKAIRGFSQDTMNSIADNLEQASDEGFTDAMMPVLQNVIDAFRQSLDSSTPEEIAVEKFVNMVVKADGSIDLSAVAELASQLDADAAATLASYAQDLGTLFLNVESGEDFVHAFTTFAGMMGSIAGKTKGGGGGGGYRNQDGGGGGGGKEKSAAEKLIEQAKHDVSLPSHKIKMAQIQEQAYEDAGELTNLNSVLLTENRYQQELADTLQASLDKMEAQLASTERGSEDWYKLADAIMDYEEQLASANNAIEANKRKIEENKEKIRQLRIELEKGVRDEIENRIQIQRDMLSGTVDMQDMMLEAIKQRYQDEWNLVKKDIEKKKQALEDEKGLISERLQARKDAESEAQKAEQLAEYQRQLALVSMDSTRTKDAKELQKKIEEIQREQGWTIAEKEAEQQEKAIDDNIKALEQYETYGDEDLEHLLENANNFSGEINEIMKMNQADMFEWMKANMQDYVNSLEAAQQQMVDSWTDTYNQMLHIIDTHQSEIDKILASENSYVAYMKQSDEYKLASDTEKLSLEYQYRKAYRDLLEALKDNDKWNHDDELFGSSMPAMVDSSSGGGGSGDGGGPSGPAPQKEEDKTPAAKYYIVTKGSDGYWKFDGPYDHYGEAQGKNHGGLVTSDISSYQAENYKLRQQASTSGGGNGGGRTTGISNQVQMAYASGGINDFTGLAMMHGTKQKPEAVLNADDYSLMRDFLDSDILKGVREAMNAFQRIDVVGMLSPLRYDFSKNQPTTNIGEVNITINEASISDDTDISELAERVGNEFVKNLNQQGFATSKYSF